MSQVAWRVQSQAASTDHRAFDQQEGTFSSVVLHVKTVFSLPWSGAQRRKVELGYGAGQWYGKPAIREITCFKYLDNVLSTGTVPLSR